MQSRRQSFLSVSSSRLGKRSPPVSGFRAKSKVLLGLTSLDPSVMDFFDHIFMRPFTSTRRASIPSKLPTLITRRRISTRVTSSLPTPDWSSPDCTRDSGTSSAGREEIEVVVAIAVVAVGRSMADSC